MGARVCNLFGRAGVYLSVLMKRNQKVLAAVCGNTELYLHDFEDTTNRI